MHVDPVAVLDACIVTRVTVLPFVDFRTQVVLVAYHLNLFVQAVQLLTLGVADGWLNHHHPIPDGNDVSSDPFH